MKEFKAAKKSLADRNAEAAAELIVAAADCDADVPILYSAIQVRTQGRVVVMGRDLRAIETLA